MPVVAATGLSNHRRFVFVPLPHLAQSTARAPSACAAISQAALKQKLAVDDASGGRHWRDTGLSNHHRFVFVPLPHLAQSTARAPSACEAAL